MHLSSLTAWPNLLFLGSKSPCSKQYVFTDDLAFAYIYVYTYMYIFQFIFLLLLLVSENNGNERRGDPCDDDWPLCCMQADRGMLLTALDEEEDLLWTYRNRITVVLYKGRAVKEPVAIKHCLEFFFLQINQSGVPTGWVAFRWGRVRVAANVQDQIFIRSRTSCVLTTFCTYDQSTLKSNH